MDVTLDVIDRVAKIRMDDGKKNAITRAAVADLGAALDEAEAKSDALVLAGPSRLHYHGIDRIMPGTSTLLADGGRINLTLRRVTKPS